MMLALLFAAGILAGFTNTLAGGGSLLVLPIMIFLGIPSPVANATNRVALLFQNITGTIRFKQSGKLEVKPIIHITIAAICGSIIGSIFAVKINSELFDKILGFVFILILLLMFKPKPKSGNRKSLPKLVEIIIFFGVGLYGGFIQAGVGFIFLATLNLIENYNLVKANAVKVFIVLCYTVFAVIVFAINGMILWKYGLLLAIGNSIGAWLGVNFAVKKGEKFVRVVLTIAVIVSCLKLFGIFKLIGINL